jgi:tetratricopeptide (TPR) repeat protein
MKRKVEELRENLDEFVQQDEYPMLVVGCVSEELAYVVKFLQGLEEKYKEHYFVVFPQPFDTPAGYIDGVVESIRLQVDAGNQFRAEKGEPPMPPLPPVLTDPRRTPAQKLEAVLLYLRSLLPDDGEDHRVIVGLLPLTCPDYESYGKLMTTIMPVPSIPPWMQQLRIVLYDDRTQKKLLDAMRARKVEHALTFDIDFSTPALTDALAKDAGDPSVPVNERMSCLMQLAALDYSYKRYPDALEKYGLLFKYYEQENIPSMQALALLGTGDTLRAAGQPVLAKQRLQQGIALALEHKALPILLNLFLSITGVCMELQHYEDAESYADSGAKVAAGVLNAFAYADMHELKGDAQIAQGKLSDGIKTYKRCQELCKTYEYFHRWTSVLERQQRLYENARLGREQREVEQEIAFVRALEKQGGSKPSGASA